jgi:hypothetical protein
MSEGRAPSIASGDPDQTRTAVATQGGDANIAPGGLTFGKLVDGGRAGKLLAEYRKVGNNGSATYNIPHTLGVIPAWCVLLGCDNTSTPNTVLAANWSEYDKWSTTEVRMRIAPAILGNATGSAMWFLIGGER